MTEIIEKEMTSKNKDIYLTVAGKLGKKFSVVDGGIKESESGNFIVSQTFAQGVIYLNTLRKTASLIPNKNAFEGYRYKLHSSDCATLTARYLDKVLGTDFVRRLKEYSLKQYAEAYSAGVPKASFLDWGFLEVDYSNLQKNDVFVYQNGDPLVDHFAVFVGGGKYLSHEPYQLSCYRNISDLSPDTVIGVYRYAN
mgnify:FL=1|tara:strand:- start:1361 stop:1948 length:588 start_codon:yes stop_codon:yes gene_type:complete